jgi:hypothetical protein
MLTSIRIKRSSFTSGAILLAMILLGMAARVSPLNAQVTRVEPLVYTHPTDAAVTSLPCRGNGSQQGV